MKDIPGFEQKYAVTKDGKVWSYPKNGHQGKWLKPLPDRKGYLRVLLGRKQQIYIHRLVLMAYSPSNIQEQVNHINAVRDDNRLENLEWCSPKQNIAHAMDNGMMKSLFKGGASHPSSKLTYTQVQEIKEMGARGIKPAKIAELFGISRSHANNLVKGRFWASGDSVSPIR